MTQRFGAGLLLSLALALGTAANAQDGAPTPPAGGTPLDLSAGEPVVKARPTSRDQVQPGQMYIPETSKDWEIRCGRAPEGQTDPCQMYQLLRDASGTPTAEITLFRIQGAPFAAGAMIVTPLETLLTRAVTVVIDAGMPKRYPFKFCNTQGCVAEVGFTQEEVDAMKRGSGGKVVIVPVAAQRTNVELTLSLAGFTAAYDKLPPRIAVENPPQQ